MGVKRRGNSRAPLSHDFLARIELVKQKIGFKTLPPKNFRVRSLTVTPGTICLLYLDAQQRAAPADGASARAYLDCEHWSGAICTAVAWQLDRRQLTYTSRRGRKGAALAGSRVTTSTGGYGRKPRLQGSPREGLESAPSCRSIGSAAEAGVTGPRNRSGRLPKRMALRYPGTSPSIGASEGAMTALVTRYAKSGDVHIAYQVFGRGPIDLVFVPGFISHIENYWEHPDLARWLLRLAAFSRVIMFDKRGTGLSDPVAAVPSLELRM